MSGPSHPPRALHTCIGFGPAEECRERRPEPVMCQCPTRAKTNTSYHHRRHHQEEEGCWATFMSALAFEPIFATANSDLPCTDPNKVKA